MNAGMKHKIEDYDKQSKLRSLKEGKQYKKRFDDRGQTKKRYEKQN